MKEVRIGSYRSLLEHLVQRRDLGIIQELMYSGNVAKLAATSPEIYARAGVCEGDGDSFSWSPYDIPSRS